MDSTVSPRLVTSVLALLFCLVASLRSGDVKPVRMVTEVVSIALVSPRAAARTGPEPDEGGVLHLAASGGAAPPAPVPPMQPFDTSQPMRADAPPFSVVPPMPASASRDRPPPAVARPPVAKPRPASARPRPKHAARPPVMAQAAPSAPEVPAVFVPLRQLGLAIQGRLPPVRRPGEPAAKPVEPVANV